MSRCDKNAVLPSFYFLVRASLCPLPRFRNVHKMSITTLRAVVYDYDSREQFLRTAVNDMN